MGLKFIGFGPGGRARYRLDDGRELDLAPDEVGQYMDTDRDMSAAPSWERDIADMEQTVAGMRDVVSPAPQVASNPMAMEPDLPPEPYDLMSGAPVADPALDTGPATNPMIGTEQVAQPPAVPAQGTGGGLPPGVRSEGYTVQRSGVRPHTSRGYNHNFEMMDPGMLPNADAVYGEFAAGAERRADALNRQETAAGQMSEANASALESRQQLDSEYRRQEEMKDKLAHYERANYLKDLDREIAEIPKMNRNRYFSENGVAAAAGLFGATIGGFLNPGGPNSTVDLAMQIIDQDMAAQQSDIDSAWRKVDQKERGYGRLVDEHQRMAEARNKKRLMGLAAIDNELAKEQNKYESEVTRAKIQEQRAQVQEAMAAKRQELGQQVYDNSRAMIDQRNQARMAGNQTTEMENRLKLDKNKFAEMQRHNRSMEAEQRAKAQQEAMGKAIAVLPDGRKIYMDPGVQLSDTQTTKIQDRISSNRKFATAANKVIELTESLGRAVDPNERKQYQAQLDTAIRTLRAEVGANLPESEAHRVESLLGSPKDLLANPDTAKKILQRTITQTGDHLAMELQQYGAGFYEEGPEPGTLAYRRAGNDELWKDDFTPTDLQKVKKKTVEQLGVQLDASIEKIHGNENFNETYDNTYQDSVREFLDYNMKYNDGSDFDIERVEEFKAKVKQLPPQQRTIEYNGEIVDPVDLMEEMARPSWMRDQLHQRQMNRVQQSARETTESLPDLNAL